MFKPWWIGGVAALLVLPSAAWAEDGAQVKIYEMGPMVVHVRTALAQADGPRLVSDGPVNIGVVADVDDGEEQDVLVRPEMLSDYWLGVQVRPLRGPINAHLGLAEDQGLVVERVMPESPAAKVEIAETDVIVSANGKPVGDVPDLLKAISAAEDQKLKLEVIQKGKRKTLTVELVKRPETGRAQAQRPPMPEGQDWQRIEQWFKRIHPGEAAGPMRFRFFGPGTILPPGTPVQPALPGNVTISITKTGEKPAKITVTRDDEKWEVTEEQLDKLPDDIRSHVERMLGRGAHVFFGEWPKPGGTMQRFDFIPDWAVPEQMKPEQPKADGDAQPEAKPRMPRERLLERRFDEMQRRLEELRKSIDELREKPAPSPSKEDPNQA